MRWIRLHFMLAALSASSGCALMASGAYNAINEPRLAFSERRFEHACRRLAEEAWSKHADTRSTSSDYREGYLDGYADYLRAGRTVEPVPVPPNRYARIAVHTPESLQAVNSHADGFRQGAADAAASGDRQRVVIPVNLPGCDRPSSCPEQVPIMPLPPTPRNSDGERQPELK